jgi:hypothetical protein
MEYFGAIRQKSSGVKRRGQLLSNVVNEIVGWLT